MKSFALSTILFLLSNAVLLFGAKPKSKWTRWSIVKSGQEEYNKVKRSVAFGARLGIQECQTQFRFDKWNCTVRPIVSHVPVFIRTMLPYANRETAFLHAISAAGVTYSLIKECRLGRFKDCGCAKRKKIKKIRKTRENAEKSEQTFIWNGCGDNYPFGAYVGKQFIDRLETGSDARALLNLHNNEVGRKAVKASMTKICKCHGVSGSCSTKSCRVALSPFRKIGDYLKQKYKRAKEAKYSNKQLRQKSTIGYRSIKEKEYELLYMVPSPNYCVRNLNVGSTGVLGRECTTDKDNQAKCDNLCTSCKLLPSKVTEKKLVQCRCKFIWCCTVTCEMCENFRTKTTCSR